MKRIRSVITKLPDKKQYVELVTALLTIPVLATVIILNVNNLKTKPATDSSKNTVQEKIVYVSPPEKESAQNADCTKGIAPLEISFPKENESVNDNPLSIDIDYTQGDYCASVWSYRVNNGRWSDYDDRSIALYNIPPGEVKFELRIKSVVTGQTKSYTRTFTYTGSGQTPSLSPAESASTSAQ